MSVATDIHVHASDDYAYIAMHKRCCTNENINIFIFSFLKTIVFILKNFLCNM